jgi:hypothetical protein
MQQIEVLITHTIKGEQSDYWMQFSLTEMMAIGTELFVSNRMLVRPMISV